MRKSTLLRRYRYLWTGEVAAASLFAFLLLKAVSRSWDWPNWILRSYGVAVVVFILLQGAQWWSCKMRLLRAGRSRIPRGVLNWFRVLKTLNSVLIGLYPIVVLGKWLVIRNVTVTGDEIFGLLIMGGAVLEQVNYYHYQLMYDHRADRIYLARHRRLRVGNIGGAIASERRGRHN